MALTTGSGARIAGNLIADEDVSEHANIEIKKIGTRTIIRSFTANEFMTSGAGNVSFEGVFPSRLLLDTQTGSMYKSFMLPDEWVSSSNITFDIYWTAAPIAGAAKFSVLIQSCPTNTVIATEDTQTVTTTVNGTTGRINKSSVTFAASVFTAGDVVGVQISRDPADANDTLGATLEVLCVVMSFTGRG